MLEIFFAQINKANASFFESGWWPGISLDVVARMAGVINIVKIVQQLGKSMFRPKMI